MRENSRSTVDSFAYLGSVLENESSVENDVRSRIDKG